MSNVTLSNGSQLEVGGELISEYGTALRRLQNVADTLIANGVQVDALTLYSIIDDLNANRDDLETFHSDMRQGIERIAERVKSLREEIRTLKADIKANYNAGYADGAKNVAEWVAYSEQLEQQLKALIGEAGAA
jgi:NAD(P)H-dependent FMN reductase